MYILYIIYINLLHQDLLRHTYYSTMRIPPEAPQLKMNTFAHPPPWGAYITYPPGAVVAYHATIWRCESSHTSWEEPAGAVSLYSS